MFIRSLVPGASARSLLAALAVAIGLAAPPPASADGRVSGRDRFIARAEVLDARPVYADVTVREPRLECVADRRRPRARVEVYGARPGDRDRYYRHDAYRDDRRRRSERREIDSRGAVIVGGLVGGAVGNRLTRDGSRGARAAGTLAGALVGAGAARELAHGYDRRRHGPRRPYRAPAYGHGHGHGRGHDRGRERCVRVVETRTERRLVHYDVTYLFRGRTFRARRDRDPGATIEIDVSVSPAHR